ncbi:MAG: hypothetical protein AW07_03957 [Candidatus Accumulibacter sp. SK-11]|nr:MAG: hypothetical protein AW07_03957 [Candidatus Accumulibacter sp. SK-11]
MRHFLVGEDRVGVGADRLRAAHVDVHVMPGEGRGLDADALLHSLGTEVRTPRPGGDGDMRADRGGGDAHRFRAVEDDRPDVARLEPVRAHHFLLCLEQGLPVVGHLHLEDVGGVEQALGVLGKAEDRRTPRRLVGTDSLEDAHAVVQGVGQHVGRGLAPWNELAVVPDEAVAIRHGHPLLPSFR